MQVAEHTIDLAGAPIFFRSAGFPSTSGAPGDHASLLYLHDLPTSSDDWLDLLARTGGYAPDLVGFGRSGKAADLEYTLAGLASFVEQFTKHLGIAPVTIVGNGWGAAAALLFAQRQPSRVRGLVLLNPLPLSPRFTWPRLARLLRMPIVGELAIGSISRRRLRQILGSGYADPGALSDERFSAIWSQFDQGTQRAILRLLRATDSATLTRVGARLNELGATSLVIAGERDPWIPASFTEEYGRHLPDAHVLRVPDAGHWPWLERPAVVEQIVAFVEQS